MAEQNNSGCQMNEALEILGMIFIANHQPAKVEQPGKESLDLPPTRESTERSTILSFYAAVQLIGSDHFCAVVLHQLFVQPVTVISLVADQPFGQIGDRRSS